MQPLKIMRFEAMQKLAAAGVYTRNLLRDMLTRFVHMCSPRPIINSLIAITIILVVGWPGIQHAHATYGLDHIFYYFLGFAAIVTILKSSMHSLLLPIVAIAISFLPLQFLHTPVSIWGWSTHAGVLLLMTGLAGATISTLFIQN